MEWTKEDQRNLENLWALSDEETSEWLEEKAKEVMSLMTYYRCAVMEIETKLKVLNEEFSLKQDRNPINSVKTRIKSFASIREKMQRKDLKITPGNIEENINDIAGVRVICSFPDDSNADQYRYPYEPTPYSVLERLANTGYIRKNNTLIDYGCGK